MCTGKTGQRARIPSALLTFEPVQGWLYAQGDGTIVARSVDGGSWFAIAGYDQDDQKSAKKALSGRDTELAALGQRLQIVLPKKIRWKTPDTTEKVGDLQMSFWEIEGAKRADNDGSLLLFSAPLREGKALLGLAFVPRNDESSSALILRSIKSIGPNDAP